MPRKPVSDDEIKAILKAEIADAAGISTTVGMARAENMDYYQGRPFGNEVVGRSSVVSSDLADTIEWILPTLIRIFCSNEDVCSFEPENENDVAAAQQATEYVNFIWNRDNRGFLNTYSWFKDALLQKNGTLKIWWDDKPKTKRERYSGLDEQAFATLASDKNVEVSEHTEREETFTPTWADPATGAPPKPSQIKVHDLVITRTIPGGKVCVEPVPPEEFLISKEARNIPDARFVGHRRQRTISDLREEGFPKEVLDNLASDENAFISGTEEISRNTVEDQTFSSGGSPIQNEAMRLIWVTECYIKIDVDGDGIAEMRKVLAAGPGAEILSNDAWDTPRPFADLTPIIMPHRYHGLAVADVIKDIQKIKSTILRQYLDNLYLQNNQREEVLEANIIDPSEVLSSAPGRKIRIKNGPAVFPIVVPPIGQFALEGLNYIDQMRENRTGVSPRTQGIGANALHETAAGERMLMSAAMGRIELIARVFAETGVRDAFRLILKLICMYQDEPRTVRLTGKPFVAYDPSQWNGDMDMQVSVGIGIGDRDQQLMHAQIIGQAQAQAAQLGFVSSENFKNTAEMLINATGQKGVDRFFSFPQDPNAAKQPVKIPPKNAGQQVNPQLEIAREQIKAKGALDAATLKAQTDERIATITAQNKSATDQHLNEVEAQRDLAKFQQEMQFEAFRAMQEGKYSLAEAHIRAAGQIAAAMVSAKVSDGADAEARESAGEAA